MAVNSKGHIFVYTRSAQTRLLEFDGKGNLVREIGKGLCGVFACGTSSASIKTTTSGAWTKARTW